MLFFRSEEFAREWCRMRKVPLRPLVSIDQLWRLSIAWYSNRLQPDARRPQPDEMRKIFADLGLTGPFWDPQSDSFQPPTSA
jgi:hypothetical protein